MRAYRGPIGGITTKSLLQETRECIRSSEITIEYGTKKAKDWETSQNLGYFYETKRMEEGKRIKRKKEEGTGDGSQKNREICFPVPLTINKTKIRFRKKNTRSLYKTQRNSENLMK